MSKLTIEERQIVVEAMRRYPAGVHRSSWGKSEDFFHEGPKDSDQVEKLAEDFFYDGAKDSDQVGKLAGEILLEHG